MRKRLICLAIALLVVVAGLLSIERFPDLASARLLECLALGALFGFAAAVLRGRAGNVLIVPCSLLLGLVALEGWALATRPTDGPPGPILNDEGIGGWRPILGWGPTRAGVYHITKTWPDGRPVYDVHATVGTDMLRKTVPSDGPRPIVFFGDSWIWGDGVEDRDTLPQAFADLMEGRIPVMNLGFSGWNPAQNLVVLQEGLYKSRLRDVRHFVLFTTTFHIERMACKGAYRFTSAPNYLLDGGGLHRDGQCSERGGPLGVRILRIARRFALFDRLIPYFDKVTRHDVDRYVAVIEAFVTTARREFGVATTLLYVDEDEEFVRGSGVTEAQIVARLRRDGVDVLVDKLPPVADETRYAIPGDGHPTPLAHKLRAAELAAHLREVDPDALEAGAPP